MPQEPKKRHSRARQGKRRAHIHLTVTKTQLCQNCGAIILPHIVCKNCGFYKGKQVLRNKPTKKNEVTV